MDLGAEVGDQINVSYYIVGPREKLLTRGAQFRLKGVVAIEGLAADRGLTPNFPGIHEADDMSEWNAPFPIDLNRIRPKDEVYWDLFRAIPKAFVSDKTAQQLWRSRFGDLTAIQIRAVLGADLQTTQTNFQRRLLEKIRPEQVGLVFQPVKADGLAAATGSTDFSSLFIGFSLFLIVSATLLVGLLFRLGVEQRGSEVGILLTVGYPISTIRRRFIKEGGLIAGFGGLIGVGRRCCLRMVTDGWITNLVVGSGGNAFPFFAYQSIKFGSWVSDCPCRSPIFDRLDRSATRQGSHYCADCGWIGC